MDVLMAMSKCAEILEYIYIRVTVFAPVIMTETGSILRAWYVSVVIRCVGDN
jgi:hypothetical protein